jgi:hypothetical protein
MGLVGMERNIGEKHRRGTPERNTGETARQEMSLRCLKGRSNPHEYQGTLWWFPLVIGGIASPAWSLS